MADGCVNSPSFDHLLKLVPAEAPLTELKLHPPFSSTHFLQPHWFPVLQNLTVLIVNGRDVDKPFELLPTFTQLQIFEADRLRLPFYERSTNLPLLRTLRKLQLRACSVQWMVGRQFPCLEECAILLPRHWELIQQYGVQLPSCKKLTYHGHPMTTTRYIHVPKMTSMELKSHDCDEQRVHQYLRYLCRVDGRISKLTALHLTFQCSERVLIKVLKYLVPLQELVLSIAHPSPSWQDFLESLAAKPSTNEWPTWCPQVPDYQDWNRSCSSQTWHVNILPHLKYLGIHCPKGFSQSERLDNMPFLRLVGWTRAQLTHPLEHLKVWEWRGSMDDIAVDYISTDYLDKHLGVSSKEYDARDYDTKIVMAMAARHLAVGRNGPLFQLHSTTLFRQLQSLQLIGDGHHEGILPCLEQIKKLEITLGVIPEYSLSLDLPLTHTLHSLKLAGSTFTWMLGRTFKTLKEVEVDGPPDGLENQSKHEGLQVDLPACTKLKLEDCPMDSLRFFSCPNLQILNFGSLRVSRSINKAALKSLCDFLFNCSCLQNLKFRIAQCSGLDSLSRFIFHGTWEQGVWRGIKSVEMLCWPSIDEYRSLVGHQRHYKKWWKEFTVIEGTMVIISASM